MSVKNRLGAVEPGLEKWCRLSHKVQIDLACLFALHWAVRPGSGPYK